jgi:hypothetical protein
MTIQVHNSVTGKKMKIAIDENMKIQSFLQELRNLGEIESGKPYYLKTAKGVIPSPVTTFREFNETEFILVQDAPPPPKAFNQLGIFVIDGSASMKEGMVKGNMLSSDAVNLAMQNTFKLFKDSRTRACYSFAIVAFGDTAKTILTPANIVDIDASQSFDPTLSFNNGSGSESTNIAAGLSIAYALADDFLKRKEGNLIHKVAIVILSDGMCHHEMETKAIAEKLKQLPGLEINCCHLESNIVEPAATELLKEIATHYEAVYSEDTIRGFFINSTSRNNRG